MSDRKAVIDRLRAVELADGMSSHAMLSAIGRAVMPCKTWKRLTCEGLRDHLIRLLEVWPWDADEPTGRCSAETAFELCAEAVERAREAK